MGRKFLLHLYRTAGWDGVPLQRQKVNKSALTRCYDQMDETRRQSPTAFPEGNFISGISTEICSTHPLNALPVPAPNVSESPNAETDNKPSPDLADIPPATLE